MQDLHHFHTSGQHMRTQLIIGCSARSIKDVCANFKAHIRSPCTSYIFLIHLECIPIKLKGTSILVLSFSTCITVFDNILTILFNTLGGEYKNRQIHMSCYYQNCSHTPCATKEQKPKSIITMIIIINNTCARS